MASNSDAKDSEERTSKCTQNEEKKNEEEEKEDLSESAGQKETEDDNVTEPNEEEQKSSNHFVTDWKFGFELEISRLMGVEWMRQGSKKYQCKICSSKLTSKQLFLEHLCLTHFMGSSAYEEKHGKIVEQDIKEGCEICDVMLNRKQLPYHTQRHHDVKFAKYFMDFVRPNLTKGEVSSLESPAGDDASSKARAKMIAGKKLTIEAVGWSLRTSYECKLCNKFPKTMQRTSFQKHIIKTHLMSLDTYAEVFGSCETNMVKHRCSICASFVLHDRDVLKRHLGTHKVTLEAYYASYVKNKVTVPANIMVKEMEKQLDKENEKLVLKNVSDWSEKCVYMCKICYKFGPSYNYDGFVKHLLKHGKTANKYTEEFGALEAKVHDYFKCELCGMEQTMNPKKVASHLKNNHDISLTAYFDTYIRKTMCSRQSLKRQADIEAELFWSSDVNQQAFKWASKCQYNCSLCGLKIVADGFTHKRVAFIAHMKDIHGKDPTALLAKIDSMMSEKCTITCQFCDKKLVWDSLIICNHLEAAHRTDLTTYFSYIVKEDLIKEKMSPSIHSNLPPHQMKPSLSDSNAVIESSSVCVYKCQICSKKEKNRFSFIQHIWANHALTVEDYTKQFKKFEDEWMEIQCRLCPYGRTGNILLWDYSVLSNHMKVVHQITLTDYLVQMEKNLRQPLKGQKDKSTNSSSVSEATRAIIKKVNKLRRSKSLAEESIKTIKILKLTNQDNKKKESKENGTRKCVAKEKVRKKAPPKKETEFVAVEVQEEDGIEPERNPLGDDDDDDYDRIDQADDSNEIKVAIKEADDMPVMKEDETEIKFFKKVGNDWERDELCLGI